MNGAITTYITHWSVKDLEHKSIKNLIKLKTTTVLTEIPSNEHLHRNLGNMIRFHSENR